MRDASPERPLLLALFDLDGFKAYNDSFGHPVGDALLVRLGSNLSAAISAVGRAYRMGGDEFCVLATVDGGRPDMILRGRERGADRARHGVHRHGLLRIRAAADRDRTTSPRRCASPTSGCTRARARAARLPGARAPTCCCACSPSATPTSATT